jgi:hypothetical protein
LIKIYEAVQIVAVNGSEPKIEIFKPFGEAFELTKQILFAPFNFEKWLIIGFAAFLSGHFAGVGFNFPFGNFGQHRTDQKFAPPDFEQWKPWLLIAIPVFIVVVLIVIILFMWLRARGNFIFTDCVVRNRGAIVEPWREYRKEGNSYFLFLLAVMFGSIAVLGLIALVIFVPLGVFGHGASDHVMTPILVVSLILLFLLWICFGILLGLISYFMVPVMYIRRCRALDAFREVLNLILDHVGPFVLFCLFGFCLVLGMMMIGGIATCLTCCLAALPYVGTVILLPVFVCLRAFGLCFIRQFGPDYDVWTTVSEPTTTATEPPPLPS